MVAVLPSLLVVARCGRRTPTTSTKVFFQLSEQRPSYLSQCATIRSLRSVTLAFTCPAYTLSWPGNAAVDFDVPRFKVCVRARGRVDLIVQLHSSLSSCMWTCCVVDARCEVVIRNAVGVSQYPMASSTLQVTPTAGSVFVEELQYTFQLIANNPDSYYSARSMAYGYLPEVLPAEYVLTF
jgi:hypothetical protein